MDEWDSVFLGYSHFKCHLSHEAFKHLCYILSIYSMVRIHVCWHIHHGACWSYKLQLVGTNYLLPWGSQWLNSGYQPWWHVTLPTDLSPWPTTNPLATTLLRTLNLSCSFFASFFNLYRNWIKCVKGINPITWSYNIFPNQLLFFTLLAF